jgi:hypothetical protein
MSSFQHVDQAGRATTTATERFGRSVLIIAALSALSWAVVILIIIAALSALERAPGLLVIGHRPGSRSGTGNPDASMATSPLKCPRKTGA